MQLDEPDDSETGECKPETKQRVLRVQFQSISAMAEYQHKSHEELKFEDWSLDKNAFFGLKGQTQEPRHTAAPDADINEEEAKELRLMEFNRSSGHHQYQLISVLLCWAPDLYPHPVYPQVHMCELVYVQLAWALVYQIGAAIINAKVNRLSAMLAYLKTQSAIPFDVNQLLPFDSQYKASLFSLMCDDPSKQPQIHRMLLEAKADLDVCDSEGTPGHAFLVCVSCVCMYFRL